MPDPLPSDIVTRLRSDSTVALAASLILAGSFPDIVSWALKAFSGKDSGPKLSVPADGGDKCRHAPRPQAAVKSDKALLAVAPTLARASPTLSGSGGDRGHQLSRRSSVSRTPGLSSIPVRVCTRRSSKPRHPKPAWVEPLSGAHVARHAADGRVRDEMTIA
jgi:hypothetical protein